MTSPKILSGTPGLLQESGTNGSKSRKNSWAKRSAQAGLRTECQQAFSPDTRKTEWGAQQESLSLDSQRGDGWGGVDMDEGDEEVQTSSYKVRKSWGWKVQHREYIESIMLQCIYCSEHFIMCIIVESLCYSPETHLILYINSTTMKEMFNGEKKVDTMFLPRTDLELEPQPTKNPFTYIMTQILGLWWKGRNQIM